MRNGRGTWRVGAWVAVLTLAGCASDPGQEVALGPCDAEYRDFQQRMPAPAGLSSRERERLEEVQRDYHVSQRCQQEGSRPASLQIFQRDER